MSILNYFIRFCDILLECHKNPSTRIITPVVTPDIPDSAFKMKGRKLLSSSKSKISVEGLRGIIAHDKRRILHLQNKNTLGCMKSNYTQNNNTEKNCDLLSELILRVCNHADALKRKIMIKRNFQVKQECGLC